MARRVAHGFTVPCRYRAKDRARATLLPGPPSGHIETFETPSFIVLTNFVDFFVGFQSTTNAETSKGRVKTEDSGHPIRTHIGSRDDKQRRTNIQFSPAAAPQVRFFTILRTSAHINSTENTGERPAGEKSESKMSYNLFDVLACDTRTPS